MSQSVPPGVLCDGDSSRAFGGRLARAISPAQDDDARQDLGFGLPTCKMHSKLSKPLATARHPPEQGQALGFVMEGPTQPTSALSGRCGCSLASTAFVVHVMA